MRLVSPLLKHAIYPALQHIGFLSRRASSADCAVVNYHGVIPMDYSTADPFIDGNLVRLEVFRRQLAFLKTHYHVIPPDHFRAWIENGTTLPPRSVLITCDDGLLNTLTDMLPILESESLPCLFFMTGASCRESPGMLWYEELYHLLNSARTQGIELPPPTATDEAAQTPPTTSPGQWWETVQLASKLNAEARADWLSRLRNRCGLLEVFASHRRWRLLNLHELRRLAAAGMIIGAHTMTHPVLAQCSEEEARREIRESKLEIERAIGMPVWAFAYPFGNPSTMGHREVRLAREAGFSCAFLNVGGNTDRSTPFELCRTHVSADMNLAELEAHMVGFHTSLQRVMRG
jgi:peptidoglycan/xylan/chitin deacetylase (PgdA/CDA1 family)